VERVLLSRHAESELSAHGLLNGDPRVPVGLTPLGVVQARALGRAIAAEPVEIAITSEFERCRLTAAIALAGRGLPALELPELGDIRNGAFDGGLIADYRAWAHQASATQRPPGDGESRVEVARRLAAGIRAVLARPERVALVVGHSLPARYVLEAVEGRNPPRVAEFVPYATVYPLSASELEAGADRLEAWAGAPTW
jgi:broad specificity phosphatase PhoE